MKKALIHIDYTNDFVALDGKLTCGEPGIRLEGTILELTKEFTNDSESIVVYAIDLHKEMDPYHPETKLFPPHNLEGTKGRQLFGKIEDFYQQTKNQENVFYLDKTRYSAFQGTNLENILRERNINEVHLIGVCTDICVLHTAVDAYNKGFDIVVHEGAVASFNQQGHEWALNHFKNTLGAKVI